MSSPMEWVAGNPARLRLQHIILNVLLFAGLLSGLYFGVTDIVVGLDPVHKGVDVLIITLFLSLYGVSRFLGEFKVTAHLATGLMFVLVGLNFVIDAGVRGPSLIVVLAVVACVPLVHTWRAALVHLGFGVLIAGGCFAIQYFRPDWIIGYVSADAQFWDVFVTFLFCLVMVSVVMRLVLLFSQERLNQTKVAQAAAIQSEKMASLGRILAGMNHEISTPVGVIGSSLSVTDVWWKEELPKFPTVLAALSREQTDSFWSLVGAGRASSGSESDSRLRRAKRTELAEALSFLPPDEAQVWAEEWEGVGIGHWNSEWRPLFDEPGHVALKFAVKLLACHHSHQNAVLAYTKLGTLVQALRSYSRSDALETALTPTDLRAGLETVLTLYVATHRFTVEILRDYEIVRPVLARPDELIQVWTNLVQNALQSMAFSGVLTVSLREVEDWAVVTVSDTGAGVPMALREKIFEPFFTTKGRDHGTGLGLGIASTLVMNQGGTIQVDDAPGGGARFTVRLPLPSRV